MSLHAQLQQRAADHNPIRVALIGAGGMGMGDTRFARSIPGVKLVAVCDIYDGRLTRAKELWGPELFITRDPTGLQAGPNMYGYVSARPTVSVDPFGLADQALNVKNVSGPTMGYCGAFDWRIKWELTNAAAKPSWIVQHIVFTIHVENCWGQDITRAFGVNPVTE